MKLIDAALSIALRAHEGQKRRGGDIPYITHPIMVALMLTKHGFSDTVVAAGLTHDVLEDTSVSEDELRKELGDAVDLVKAVSEDKSLPWKERKQQYIENIRRAPNDAKAISVADKVHNAQSLIATHEKLGADVWKFFNKGKEEKLWFEESMLMMLRESWQHPLVDEYAALVEKIKQLS